MGESQRVEGRFRFSISVTTGNTALIIYQHIAGERLTVTMKRLTVFLLLGVLSMAANADEDPGPAAGTPCHTPEAVSAVTPDHMLLCKDHHWVAIAGNNFAPPQGPSNPSLAAGSDAQDDPTANAGHGSAADIKTLEARVDVLERTNQAILSYLRETRNWQPSGF
jgi:hypothetical protein